MIRIAALGPLALVCSAFAAGPEEGAVGADAKAAGAAVQSASGTAGRPGGTVRTVGARRGDRVVVREASAAGPAGTSPAPHAARVAPRASSSPWRAGRGGPVGLVPPAE